MRGNNRKQFVIGFMIFFVIIAVTMGKAFIKQEKQAKIEKARYEKMVNEEGKYKLTKDVLEEDHDRYLEDAEEGEKIFKDLITAFAGAMILVLIYMFMNIFDFASIVPVKNKALVKAGALIILGVIVVFSANFFSEIFRVSKKSEGNKNAKYDFYELNVVSTHVETKTTTTGSGSDRRTTRTNYYYLDLEGNKEIKTNQMYYERAKDNPGLYYAGMTEKGALFSLYPATEFELVN
ncbi:hypothetical protein SAMN02745111_01150 [Eubacterium uniforme]|uniref:Uncharacterized protein n=1 Tax=Eubacterium uniforme TaxID=39495 RepID=A0A1T4VM56_9FIRM|nr:hypothetical protein [Eubacterium uniforme]SKA65631.1 hypothetical protein SAMN02745111_01150 [Eubacterium uniforme]